MDTRKMIWTIGGLLLLNTAAYADAGDRVEERLDNRGDRIEERLDNRGDRIDERLDNRGDRVDERLDNKGDRIDRRLDNRSDRAAAAGRDGLAERLDNKGDRIEEMSLAQDNLAFSACGNTHARMSEASGKEVEILPEASMVPSGVVRLMELQEQGWSYVRP